MSERYTLGPDIDLDEEVVLDKAGRRITEARAEQLAEDTLREVRRGRPSLSGEPESSPRVSFRIPEQLRGFASSSRRNAKCGPYRRSPARHWSATSLSSALVVAREWPGSHANCTRAQLI
jgi:hypothetical protein